MSTDKVPAVGLKDAERRLRWLAAICIFNVVLSTSYQDALFLAHHQRQSIPPAMFIGSLLTAFTTVLLNRLLRRRPAAGALRLILLALGVLTLGTAAWNYNPTPQSTFALFLFIEVATTVGVAATWTYFQAPLEAAQIRWLLPRLGTYAGLGGLLAGSAITLVLRQPSKPEHLIWVSGVAWLIAGMLVRTDYAARVPAKRRGTGQQSHFRQLFSIPLVRWMTIGTAGIVWTGLLLQYETRVAMKSAWAPSQIAFVMCIVLAVSSVGGIATQALLTTPVLERWGVGLALAILPALLMTCLGAYFYTSFELHATANVTVWIMLLALLLDKTLRPNLHRPAESCLVAALSPAVRPSLLLVLGGILNPIIKAAGSLLLWGVESVVDTVHSVLAEYAPLVGLVARRMPARRVSSFTLFGPPSRNAAITSSSTSPPSFRACPQIAPFKIRFRLATFAPRVTGWCVQMTEGPPLCAGPRTASVSTAPVATPAKSATAHPPPNEALRRERVAS